MDEGSTWLEPIDELLWVYLLYEFFEGELYFGLFVLNDGDFSVGVEVRQKSSDESVLFLDGRMSTLRFRWTHIIKLKWYNSR